eukprot:265824-Rhodomonas_salina.1
MVMVVLMVAMDDGLDADEVVASAPRCAGSRSLEVSSAEASVALERLCFHWTRVPKKTETEEEVLDWSCEHCPSPSSTDSMPSLSGYSGSEAREVCTGTVRPQVSESCGLPCSEIQESLLSRRRSSLSTPVRESMRNCEGAES